MVYHTIPLLALALTALASPQGKFGGGNAKGGGLGDLLSTLGKGGSQGGKGGMADLLGMLGKMGGKGGKAGELTPGKGTDLMTVICSTHDGKNPLGKMVEAVFGGPNGPGPDEKCMKDDSGGSGPFKANYTEDASLPGHTIYAPKVPPPQSEKLPVIVWGNGMCMAVGTMFYNFLNELSSYGFLIVANGKPNGGGAAQSNYKDLIKSVDWATTNPAAKKYGNIDTTKIIAAGQSCGGVEALEATINDPRIKYTILFNSGYLKGSNAQMMSKFKHPVAYFLGGPKDMAEKNGENDYSLLPSSTPSILLSIDNGHMGSYYQKGAGKMGKAAVAFLKWQFKGDASQKSKFCSASESPLTKLGFNIQSKNGMC